MNDLVIIEDRIFTIRGQKVMIDKDLAELYGVQTKRLNEAVKRNKKRFPNDFMFKLNKDELNELVANCDQFKTLKHSSNLPYAFTEQGVSMLSSVLNSDRAIAINVEIIRAFVRLRQYAIAQTVKTEEIEQLKQTLMLHIENTTNKLDEHANAINQIVEALNNLIAQPKETEKIGFKTD